MMLEDTHFDLFVKVYGLQDPVTGEGMVLYLVILIAVQGGRFVQDTQLNGDLPDIVKHPCLLYDLQPVQVEPHLFRDEQGVLGNTLRMAFGVNILGFNGNNEGLNHGKITPLYPFQEQGVVYGHGCFRGDGSEESPVLF